MKPGKRRERRERRIIDGKATLWLSVPGALGDDGVVGAI